MLASLRAMATRFYGTFFHTVSTPSDVADVTHLLEAAPKESPETTSQRPILHTGPSPYSAWVDSLDEEVTEHISGRQVEQLLLHAGIDPASLIEQEESLRSTVHMASQTPASA
jgi:hypothetical protein